MRRVPVASIPGPQRVRDAVEEFLQRMSADDRARALSVVVFGSVARDEATAESDVDLLIVWRGAIDDAYHRLIRIAADIQIDRGVDLSIHPFSEGEYAEIQRIRTGFFENVEREGLVVA